MKRILGLDLGTNSIGWALVEKEEEKYGKIIGMGSRIIPMDKSEMDNFNKGTSVSQTAERTRLRMVRRLRERHLLRRERLHRVLNKIGFLPAHYASQIDFKNKNGSFLPEREPKIAYKPEGAQKKYRFLFEDSYNEMLSDFQSHQPELTDSGRKVPQDWTIYYLRKKALNLKITKEELAWIILNFNQKRGYYQLRGEDDETTNNKKVEEFHALEVIKVNEREETTSSGAKWYDIELENGWIYSRQSNIKPALEGKVIELIVSYSLDQNGKIKTDNEGNEKRSFRMPKEDDWTLIKKRTEQEIDKSDKTVGEYIYDNLLRNPYQKIRGKLVSTIERKFYRGELEQILNIQKKYHEELDDKVLLKKCVENLYPKNDIHRNALLNKDLVHLILNDIVFYQRPLKSKKSSISNCPLEYRLYVEKASGEKKKVPLKCIPKSHPLYQEFRLWQYVKNLRLIENQKLENGKLLTNVDVTEDLIPDEETRVELFKYLDARKTFKQDDVLKFVGKRSPKERVGFSWNYPEDKEYPGNETRYLIESRLKKVEDIPDNWLDQEKFEDLWHLLYSVSDQEEIKRGLESFARKHQLSNSFVEIFRKFPRMEREYGAFSSKAIKKLLPLMRMGEYWKKDNIHPEIIEKAQKIVDGEVDDEIDDALRERAQRCPEIVTLMGVPLWLASYLVYGRHSEMADVIRWRTASGLEQYIKEFKQHSLRNPVVEQVVIETLRVVKDIWNYYGEGHEAFFDEIHVEIGRELKIPADKRKSITNQIQENENTNLRMKALLIELFNDPEVPNVRPYSPVQQEILKIYEDGVLNGEGEIPDDIQKISKMSSPSRSQLIKYKLWLEQRYRSPYTGAIIPLNKLFTSEYEIEHIIPQARYFDDSFSNKVICESEVNRVKGSLLGLEFIKNMGGKLVELNYGKKVTIFSSDEYQKFVKDHYGNSPRSKGKMQKLLMDEIPQSFIERQLNDSRYISKLVRNLLSNVVREENENSPVAKRLITCTGAVTNSLKQEWGLNDVWNDLITPRFERLNGMGETKYGAWTNKGGKRVFQIQMPLELQKGFSKKRIDHRHHALDALIVASATRSHVNFLSNEASKPGAAQTRFDLRNKLCFKQQRGQNGSYDWKYYKPWETFTYDAKEALSKIVVSFKVNHRVLNKSANRHYKWIDTPDGKKKKLVPQTKGENWSVRKSLHKDTVLGKVSLRKEKTVSLSVAFDSWQRIVDKSLKRQIGSLIEQGYDKNLLQKYFKDRKNEFEGKNISKVSIYYFDDEMAARRVILDTSFNSEKRIEGITDSGIRKILYAHLANKKYHGQKDEKGKEIPPYELAFAPEGIDEMNANIKKLNGGKPHCPIFKVRLSEPIGEKFQLGNAGNKDKKFVEVAKGTNLFYGIYANEEGERSFDTIPFYLAMERQRQGLLPVPEKNEKGHNLLFSLSPGDLVYIHGEESDIEEVREEEISPSRVYKMVSSTGPYCFFIPHFVASPIVHTLELGANNKAEKAWDGQMIKKVCRKIAADRLGNVNIEK